jgi:hypothetical protein
MTPFCPLCNRPPVLVFSDGKQAFCGNDACTMFVWDSTMGLDDNLMAARELKLPGDAPS